MRKIIHVDMDCFYAAIEVRDRPHLKGLPVAVGGSPNSRGVVATANYEARKFGVRSAIASKTALRLCPQLQFIFPNFKKYKAVSQDIHRIFKNYTDLIEPLSLDEAFLDVTSCSECDGIATNIAKKIRQDILLETSLTCSAGIAPNKFLAKIASDWRKPNGQFTVAPHQVDDFVKDLPVKKIFGVGKVTAHKMSQLGIETCGDLQRWSMSDLEFQFGSWGASLYNLSRGLDERPVNTSRERKSLSVENTFGIDLVAFEDFEKPIVELYQSFCERIEKAGIVDSDVKTAFVKIKFTDFQSSTHECQIQQVPNLQVFQELAEFCWQKQGKPVRLIGIGVRLRSESRPQRVRSQLSLF